MCLVVCVVSRVFHSCCIIFIGVVGRRVVVGGWFAGLAIANSLLPYARRGEVSVTLVERSRFTEYRPGYLFVWLGSREPDDIRAPVALLGRRGVEVLEAEAKAIDPGNRVVRTSAGM